MRRTTESAYIPILMQAVAEELGNARSSVLSVQFQCNMASAGFGNSVLFVPSI